MLHATKINEKVKIASYKNNTQTNDLHFKTIKPAADENTWQ